TDERFRHAHQPCGAIDRQNGSRATARPPIGGQRPQFLQRSRRRGVSGSTPVQQSRVFSLVTSVVVAATVEPTATLDCGRRILHGGEVRCSKVLGTEY